MAGMIRVDAWWLCATPQDMRSGADRLLAQVLEVFGEAQPHHAYLFANRRGNRLKIVLHDGYGLWLAQRRLHQGRFHWPTGQESYALTAAQFQALVVGLPWAHWSPDHVIRVL